jgi:hypothetical protein
LKLEPMRILLLDLLAPWQGNAFIQLIGIAAIS